MSSTCGQKTFYESKALINFKFANEDSMHYVDTTFDFFGNYLLENKKYLIESSYFCVE